MLFKRLKTRLKRAEGDILAIKEELKSFGSLARTPSQKDQTDCASLIDEWMNGGKEE